MYKEVIRLSLGSMVDEGFEVIGARRAGDEYDARAEACRLYVLLASKVPASTVDALCEILVRRTERLKRGL